jgi:hypothetical protein
VESIDKGSISLCLPVFSASLKEVSFVFPVLRAVLPLVRDHSLYPVYSGFKDAWQHFVTGCPENCSDGVQQILLALTIVII